MTILRSEGALSKTCRLFWRLSSTPHGSWPPKTPPVIASRVLSIPLPLFSKYFRYELASTLVSTGQRPRLRLFVQVHIPLFGCSRFGECAAALWQSKMSTLGYLHNAPSVERGAAAAARFVQSRQIRFTPAVLVFPWSSGKRGREQPAVGKPEDVSDMPDQRWDRC